MVDDLLESVEGLISSKTGDVKRLKYIRETLEQGKELYVSDKNYVESLVQKTIPSVVEKTKTEEKKLPKEESDPKEIPIHEYYTYKLITTGEIKQEILLHHDGRKKLLDAVADLTVKKNISSFSSQNSKGFKLIQKIVSSQLDADRMDYLLRDSAMSGVQFGQVDIDRIIQNMAIVKNRSGVYHLAIHERAIGNIEEMLDARYKMYRWFYNHHTVVATNELIKSAIKMLIKEKKIAELFHWSSFAEGFSTDEYILTKLKERMKKTQYLKVKGLIDRQYFPIAIFKSTPDFGRLIANIMKKAKISQGVEIVGQAIIDFFQEDDGAKKIQVGLDKKGGILKKCELFQATVTMKPYQPFSHSKEKVYLFRSPQDDLCELYSESSYFQKINEEWEKFKNLYLFYIIPGLTKEKAKKYDKTIREVLAIEISKYYKNK